MSAPDWKDALPTPKRGASLQEAWFTTYDEPDTSLLVEHLLPSLLGAAHSLTHEIHERNLFFGELSTALEDLRERITIISSPCHAERQPSPYPWLWRYINHFTVGANARAVQHAKLWAFHWKVGNEDYLELHVSSANLTTSAFKRQVQAGWRISMQLDKRHRRTALQTWQEFVPFLKALGASAGDIATARIQRLLGLLSRVECPADIGFVASIPGGKSAARHLKQFVGASMQVLTPTIGEWNEKNLKAWSADTGIEASKTHLNWITQEHPWAASNGWTLSTAAALALSLAGVKFDCLPNTPRFASEHQDSDERWSHAKLYLIRSKNKKRRRLLITSANWSPSAWGVGRQSPRNFELGVVIETDWAGLETMGIPFGADEAPFCIETPPVKPYDINLQWAEARWDGTRIQLLARSSDQVQPITALVSFTGGSPTKRMALVDGVADMPWVDPEHTPITAKFMQGHETLGVNIIDLRTSTEFARTPLPEVDPAISAALREDFLLLRYGGPMRDEEAVLGGAVKDRSSVENPTGVDYSVQAWCDARRAFGVVDKWHATLEQVKDDPMRFDKVRLDGVELRALYGRRAAVYAVLATEELGWRLSEET